MLRTLLLAGLVCFPSSLCAAPPDPQVLAKRIDDRLAEKWHASNVQPAPRADDAEFMRRASLDLTGRVPQVSDIRVFLDQKAPDKRRQLIATLLDEPRHAVHFTNIWRAILVPETTTSAQGGYFRSGFEGWLRQRF